MITEATPCSEALEQWIASRVSARKLRPRSVDVYRQHFRNLVSVIGDKPIGEVTLDDAKLWEARLARLTSTTHYSRLTVVSVAFDWMLTEHEAIRVNVFRKLLRPNRASKSQRTPAEVDVVKRLHEVAAPRERVMIELASVLGLRRFEIAKLKRSDLSVRRGILAVEGKGGKQAELTVPRWLVESVAEFCDETGVPATGWVFPGRTKGEPLSPGQVGRLLTDLSHRAGEHVTPHQYRHMAGTEANKTHGLKQAQKLLRHTSSTTTDTYIHADTEEMRPTTDSLGDLFGWGQNGGQPPTA